VRAKEPNAWLETAVLSAPCCSLQSDTERYLYGFCGSSKCDWKGFQMLDTSGSSACTQYTTQM